VELVASVDNKYMIEPIASQQCLDRNRIIEDDMVAGAQNGQDHFLRRGRRERLAVRRRQQQEPLVANHPP